MSYRKKLVEGSTLELTPLGSIDASIDELGDNSLVSVIVLPKKGLDASFRLVDRLKNLGHRPVPHITARLVEDREHVRRIAKWLRSGGHETAFVIAGDATKAAGPYEGAYPFLADLFAADHGLKTVGIAAYPDGHSFISHEVLREQLHMKQALLSEANVNGWACTQMCFDTDRITSWLREERENGLTLPIFLGLPGVVSRAKLATLGMRIGVGASLRFLKKNRAAITKLMMPGAYDPDEILEPMSAELEVLGITGLHLFTFNQVKATNRWRRAVVAESPDFGANHASEH